MNLRPPAITPLGWAAYGLAVAVIGLDQLSKWWITQVFHLAEKGSVPILPFFNLTFLQNRGVSFGMLRAEADLARWGLALFSLVVAVALSFWVRRSARLLPTIAMGLVIGGAVGNLVDRVLLGAVTDFLDFSALYFPWIFNLADSAISVGVALLLLDSVVFDKKP